MRRTVINELQDEWQIVVRSKAAQRHMQGWGEASYSGFRDVGEIIEALVNERRAIERDRLLAPLASRAPRDQLAARVLLQAMLPSVQALVSKYRNREDAPELVATILAAMVENIRSYPFDRRPERIAANLTFDTQRRLHDEGRRAERRAEVFGKPVSLDEPGRQELEERRAGDPVAEVLDLVRDAVADGRLDPDEGRLVVSNRVFDVPLDEMPELAGLQPDTRRRYRLRAERKLQAAESDRTIEV